jgi:hypothetical protein
VGFNINNQSVLEFNYSYNTLPYISVRMLSKPQPTVAGREHLIISLIGQPHNVRVERTRC